MTRGATGRCVEPELLEVVELADVLELVELVDVLGEWAADGVFEVAQLVNRALEPDSAMVVNTKDLPRRGRSRVPFGVSDANRISRNPS